MCYKMKIKIYTISVSSCNNDTISIFIFLYMVCNKYIFKNRSKEIGILSFMGLDLYTIGKIYFVENMLIGISSCITGIIIGIITSRFFK